ncbi:hypothetical protein ACLQ24_28720 [Micromonospora sp. DT4]|uniref:hypothetical protein n=1 Tax=Micromonospora sp. DT4 TaxID=3393438 RepID=UPI003CEDA0D1
MAEERVRAPVDQLFGQAGWLRHQVQVGLLPLALLNLRRADAVGDSVTPRRVTGWSPADGRPVGGLGDEDWAGLDWGPHEPSVRPLLLAHSGDGSAATAALRALPDGPHDLLREVRLCLVARAALAVGELPTSGRAAAALRPAAAELAAGSGVLTAGPVAGHLADLAAALGHDEEAAGHRRTARLLTARVRAADAT